MNPSYFFTSGAACGTTDDVFFRLFPSESIEDFFLTSGAVDESFFTIGAASGAAGDAVFDTAGGAAFDAAGGAAFDAAGGAVFDTTGSATFDAAGGATFDAAAQVCTITSEQFEMDPSLLEVLQEFCSCILRGSTNLDSEALEDLNSFVGNTLRFQSSPRAETYQIAMAKTPSLRQPVSLVLVKASTLKHEVTGINLVTFVCPNIPSYNDSVTSVDQHSMTIKTADPIRNMFSRNMIKHLTINYPDILTVFGKDTLGSIFGMRKSDLKMNLFLVSYVVENLMSMSENTLARDLWIFMFQWLMFLRYIELLVGLMSQTVQIPNFRDKENMKMEISGSFLKKLKVFLQELTPACVIKRFSTLDINQNCIMYAITFDEHIQKLEMLFEHISKSIRFDSQSFLNHLHALKEMVKSHRELTGPEHFVNRSLPHLFEDRFRLSGISHSTDPNQFLRCMSDEIRFNSKRMPSRDFFQHLDAKDSIFRCLMTMRIDQVKKQKELHDVEVELRQSKIAAKIREQESRKVLAEVSLETFNAEQRFANTVRNSQEYDHHYRDSRDPRDSCDPHYRDSHYRDSRDPRDSRDSHYRDPRDSRDPHYRDPRDSRDPHYRDSRDSRDPHYRDSRDSRDQRDYRARSPSRERRKSF